MVNNNTNMNKTNNCHLRNSLNIKKTTTDDVGNPSPVAGLKQLMGSQPSPLDKKP
jgi:hypothetical protein